MLLLGGCIRLRPIKTQGSLIRRVGNCRTAICTATAISSGLSLSNSDAAFEIDQLSDVDRLVRSRAHFCLLSNSDGLGCSARLVRSLIPRCNHLCHDVRFSCTIIHSLHFERKFPLPLIEGS